MTEDERVSLPELENTSRDAIAIAGSWTLTAEFLRLMPELIVRETHPGDGMYDCLEMRIAKLPRSASPRGGELDIDINRAGSLHVHQSPTGAHMSFRSHEQLSSAYQSRACAPLARLVLETCGVTAPTAIPRTTRRTLTVRVIAAILAARVFDSHDWDVRSESEMHATGGWDEPEEWKPPFPEMTLLYPDDLWVVLRDGDVVGWIGDGWFWNLRGERIDAMALRARGASFDQIAAELTRRQSKQSSPPEFRNHSNPFWN